MGISPYFGGEGYRIVIGGANPLTLSSLLFPSLLLKVFFSHYPLSLSSAITRTRTLKGGGFGVTYTLTNDKDIDKIL